MVVGSISERERPAMGIKCKWGLQHVALFNRGPLTKGHILRPLALYNVHMYSIRV